MSRRVAFARDVSATRQYILTILSNCSRLQHYLAILYLFNDVWTLQAQDANEEANEYWEESEKKWIGKTTRKFVVDSTVEYMHKWARRTKMRNEMCKHYLDL